MRYFAADTSCGSVRQYNEDRISVILNATLSPSKSAVNFFGVYDGHSGSACSEFLKENLHRTIFAEKTLLEDFDKVVASCFRKLDDLFARQCELTKDKSGSCALMLLETDQRVFLASTGDSRAVGSFDRGARVESITTDHKPELSSERKRVFKSGGYFYYSSTTLVKEEGESLVKGPMRVFPGRLTVTRSFGDVESKTVKQGGNPHVLIVDPFTYSLGKANLDFIVMGSDGLFEQLTNQQICDFVIGRVQGRNSLGLSVNEKFTKEVAGELIRLAIDSGSQDNISVILLFFENSKLL